MRSVRLVDMGFGVSCNVYDDCFFIKEEIVLCCLVSFSLGAVTVKRHPPAVGFGLPHRRGAGDAARCMTKSPSSSWEA